MHSVLQRGGAPVRRAAVRPVDLLEFGFRQSDDLSVIHESVGPTILPFSGEFARRTMSRDMSRSALARSGASAPIELTVDPGREALERRMVNAVT